MHEENNFRRFRNVMELSQEQLAEVAQVSQKVISQIETGKKRPTVDMADRLARSFNQAWELKASMTFEQRTEFFSVPYLNKVDKHVQTTLDVLIEECQECVASMEKLKKLFRNETQLTVQEWFDAMELLEQAADLYPALKMAMVSLAITFGFDLSEVNERLISKLTDKGYYQDEGGAMAPV